MADSEKDRIVFVGPSMSLEQARMILPNADFRPPVKRGDLEGIPSGALVGIVDGLFAQTLAISRGEIRDAIDDGVIVYGAASMGALRASELPCMIGVGRIFEMYRSGLIERDDEVAVLVNADTNEALSEPLVNVRFAVERLMRSGTLSRKDGNAIVEACTRLHYTERTYPRILNESKLAQKKDIRDIARLLRTFDLKKDDARLLLETISTAKGGTVQSRDYKTAHISRPAEQYLRVNVHEDSHAPVMVWESGDIIPFDELVRFLKLTGKFEVLARAVIGRMTATGAALAPTSPRRPSRLLAENVAENAQVLLDSTRAQWGWESPEEAHVTMRDLGLGLDDVADSLEAEERFRRLIYLFATKTSDSFLTSIRIELWFQELALKRETLRLGALQFFARQGSALGVPTESEMLEARRCIARIRGAFRWQTVVSTIGVIGVTAAELEEMTETIAFARRAAHPLIELMERRPTERAPVRRRPNWERIGLQASRKAEGSARFTLREAEAAPRAEKIAQQMGLVRIGLVGELDTLGVYIAQAFGERSGWSSSFSSGKAETRDGARVGSIMEEVEIYAQDAYCPAEKVRAPYAEYSDALPLLDPRELGLPFDSRYSDSLAIDWSPCLDLISGRYVLVPCACLVGERQYADILYSPRLGGKIFSSSGLGSGFSLAEAIVHAAAEYVERHAYRLAELELDNPGGVGVRQFWFVDEQSLSTVPARIVKRFKEAGVCVRILDITSEIAIPTFFVRIFDDLFKTDQSVSSDGFACHPDPEVAVTMALLEAAQTRGGYIAGGREDYSLRARSLGRHERPRTAVPRWQAFWFSNDRPVRSLEETTGFKTSDVLEELEWMADRILEAGPTMILVADYTLPRLQPAHAVRVFIPGLETTNPLFTGPRARATVLRDLLPRGKHAR